MKLKTTLVFLLSLFSFSFYQAQAQCTFEENNGIVVIEAENASLPSNWKKETSKTPFTGNSYIIWRGSNSFGTPGGAKITYRVKINSPGKYRFIWRNIIGVVASSNATTEHNDSWLKINASDFYGQKGSSKVWPKGSGKTPNPEGASANGFFKVYANSLSWNWGTWTSDFDGHFIYAIFNSPGTYDIIVANRSNGHAIDRMVLYKESQYSEGQAQSLSRPQSSCSGGGGGTPPPPPPPPADNEPPTVTITNPTNGANIATGSNVTVNLNSNDPDGSISKHEIFVNGSKVDTDGSSYSPHVIQNIAAGNYTIRAKVTDNSGATAESTVSITVGSGGGTPPPPPPPGENNPPTVSITSPAGGANVSVGSTVTVGVSASDSDGTIAKYQVYVNNVLKDTDGTTYTPYKITNIAAGNYAIKVTVTDNDGATASATVNISAGGSAPPPPPPGGNNPPTVTITSPSDGQSFSVGSTVTVNLTSGDSDGTVTKHQIFVNGVLKDTDPSSYTPYKITNIAAGNYAIKATVTDNDGATASSTVNIAVGSGTPPPPPPSGNAISLTLINATTDGAIGPLTNGTNITSGSNKNVRADVALGNVMSVHFKLTGATSRNWTENAAPYALFGDLAGNFANGTFNGGTHSLTVEAWSGQNKTGIKLETLVVSFTVAGSGKGAIAYPNPVKEGPVSIRLPEEIQGQASYAVISPSGTEVARGTIDSTNLGDNQSIQIASENMKNDGVYYLVIQANYSSYTVPIIKQ